MAEGNILLAVRGVQKSFAPVEGSAPVSVLRDINFELGRGESLAILGPSGSGKSTLLNVIGGLDRPDSGSVLVDGEAIESLSPTELAAVRNRKVGFVFQAHYLLPQCSVLENVLVPTLASKSKATPEEVARAEQLLKRVGLGHRLHHRPAELSGGEQQRAAVVRALINQPNLLLADEPTGSLDSKSAATLAELLISLKAEQKLGVIVVTHSQDLASQMDRRMQIRDGQLSAA
jgi:lipoprotein-releasing system ATP-binding protein